jgi:hypothetical protein
MRIGEVRVLTVRQPWAWAIVHGGKDVENRSWLTKYRGPLLIHAGSAFDPDGYDTVRELANQPPPAPRELLRGAIIGVVELVDCVQDSRSGWAISGQWHWALRHPQPLHRAVPCPGRLGLWRPPPGLTWRPGGTRD